MGHQCRPCRRPNLRPHHTSQRGREHLMGKPVDCQSLLSKQELGLRVINHAPSDSNPGPYLYPKKCRWSPVPSSIKETDSSNKEAPYQISAGEPEAARGRCGKGFYEAGTQRSCGGSWGFNPWRWECRWALALAGQSRDRELSAKMELNKTCSLALGSSSSAQHSDRGDRA